MSGFVLDASVTLAWCFRDQASPESTGVLDRLEEDFAAVPAIWPLEVANILAVAERRGRIDAAEIAAFAAVLEALDIRVDTATAARGLREILGLARREGLSSYDACYLDLAMREGLALATRDAALAAAARRCGVAVIEA